MGKIGVNALSRANPISTAKDQLIERYEHIWCQCPVSGESHFYPL